MTSLTAAERLSRAGLNMSTFLWTVRVLRYKLQHVSALLYMHKHHLPCYFSTWTYLLSFCLSTKLYY